MIPVPDPDHNDDSGSQVHVLRNRGVLGIGLGSLLSDTGHEMATAALPGFMRSIGAPAAALGAIEGVADAALSASKVAGGVLADRPDVYGLDMTPEMLDLARRNQAEAGIENAEFLFGTIEDIPLPDASVDVIISNCVINLAADKSKVLAEAHRVLRSGGLFAVSDVVLLRSFSQQLTKLMGLWTGCVTGALVDTDYDAKLKAVGFHDTQIQITLVHDRRSLTAWPRNSNCPKTSTSTARSTKSTAQSRTPSSAPAANHNTPSAPPRMTEARLGLRQSSISLRPARLG